MNKSILTWAAKWSYPPSSSDYVTKHHDIHHWRSLRLSEDDKTPGQIKLFSQLYPPEQYISHLQSLSISNIESKLAKDFLSQLVSFDHLVSLTIGHICEENIQPFQLPSLQQLRVTACKHTTWMMVSKSIRNCQIQIYKTRSSPKEARYMFII